MNTPSNNGAVAGPIPTGRRGDKLEQSILVRAFRGELAPSIPATNLPQFFLSESA